MRVDLPCGCCTYDTEEVNSQRGRHYMGDRLVWCENDMTKTFVVRLKRPTHHIAYVEDKRL